MSVRIHVTPVFAPARIHEKFLANYLSRWTFRRFIIFFCSGRGGGVRGARAGGEDRLFIENARRGGGLFPGGGGAGGCLWRIGEFFGGGGG